MSSRLRGLLAATALCFAMTAGMWVLGVGVGIYAPHSLATSDTADRAIMQRTVAGAVKAALRVPLAASIAEAPRLAAADVALADAVLVAGAAPGRARLYALLNVYQL